MNKIYKVIWSKVKHQYVVTSEFAHSCTKSTTSRVGKSALAALAAFVLTAGVGGVQAADPISSVTFENEDGSGELTLNHVNNWLQTENGNFRLYNDGGIAISDKFAVNPNGVVRELTVANEANEEIDVAATLTSQQDALDAYEAGGIEAGTVAPDATGSIAIGTGSAVESSHLNSASAGSTGSVALGENTKARNRSTTAIGAGAVAWGDKSTALGNNARTAKDSSESVSVGYWAQANADNSIALGSRSIADEANTVSVGNDTLKRRVTNAADARFESGSSDLVTAGQLYAVGIVPGEIASSSRSGSIAIGKGAEILQQAANSTVLGDGARVKKGAEDAIAIGQGAHVDMNAAGSTAIGQGSHVSSGITNAVALGHNSVAYEADTVSVGDSKQGLYRRVTNVDDGKGDYDAVNVKQMKKAVTDATVGAGMVQWDSTTDETTGETTYQKGMLGGVQFKGDGILSSANGESYLDLNEYGASLNMNTTYVHVTDGVATMASGTNRLQVTEDDGTVVDGDFSAGSGQFKVLEDGTIVAFNGNSSFALDDSGIGAKYANNMMNVDSTGVHLSANGLSTVDVTAIGTTFSAPGHTGTTVISGDSITTGTIKANSMTVGGKDVATVDDVTNATKDAVKYDENGELHAGQDGTGKLDLDKENGSASLTSGNGAHSIVVNNEGTTVNGGLTVKGGLNITDSEGNTTSVATDADLSTIKGQIGVGEGQTVSNALTNKGETLVAGINQNTADISKNAAAIGDVTALKGTNANGEKYTNLTDAVNGNYDRIEQNTTAIAQNSQAINTLGHQVSDLGDEIDSVGAISATLAGLHPLDYDGTGSKFQISAAMGTYDGTQAAAIGGFYHFNRDVMMSLGGATSFEGSKKTAANIGVTFRVGEGASGKSVSDDVMARLEAMDQKIAALEQENKELKNVLGAIDTSLSKEFPDVPANHWAYEAVTKLAGNDVVAGYPDGEFHGDRTMTRYEMAEIIYKAMSKGVQVDQKLVEEFKPEMEQVAANTEGAETTPAAAAETAQPAEENA